MVQEALALGIASSTLNRRVEEGILVRRRPGILTLPGAVDEHLLDLHAACRKLGAIVSHQSAAYVHRLDRPRHLKPSVTVARNNTKDMAGVIVHQLHDLDHTHIMVIDGLTVTIPERTIIDLAAVIGEDHLLRIVDNGLAGSRIDLTKLDDLFAEVGRRGKPGTAVLRRTLEARSGSYTPPDSELERRLLLLIERASLSAPDRQFKASWLTPVNGRIDLAYPGHRLVIEADGRRWHLLAEAFENDRLRDNAAQLTGWRILRFTWKEITEHPDRVTLTIKRALEDERF